MFETFSLKNALSKQWLLQTLFIIFAVLVSIFTITWILEKSLVKQALELEADSFIANYQEDANFPLPRTRNLIGYLVTPTFDSGVPDDIRTLSPGLYPDVIIQGRDKAVPVYVRKFDNNLLYLIFEGANIDRLVGVFGLIPMSILLILIYTSSWIAYKLTWRAASPRKIDLIIDIENELIANTHKTALDIIIGNILGNAIKYTQQGTIEITLADDQVVISDTGIGIPDDLLPTLFERHVRGRGLNQAGEGLGLAIVKRLCDQFDWNINIQNNESDGITVTLAKHNTPASTH